MDFTEEAELRKYEVCGTELPLWVTRVPFQCSAVLGPVDVQWESVQETKGCQGLKGEARAGQSWGFIMGMGEMVLEW